MIDSTQGHWRGLREHPPGFSPGPSQDPCVCRSFSPPSTFSPSPLSPLGKLILHDAPVLISMALCRGSQSCIQEQGPIRALRCAGGVSSPSNWLLAPGRVSMRARGLAQHCCQLLCSCYSVLWGNITQLPQGKHSLASRREGPA